MDKSTPGYQEIIDLVKSGIQVEYEERIKDLCEAVNQYRSENASLKKAIKDLRDALGKVG